MRIYHGWRLMRLAQRLSRLRDHEFRLDHYRRCLLGQACGLPEFQRYIEGQKGQ